MAVFKDIGGNRYGRLVAEEFVNRDRHGFAFWRCKCDCGKEKIVRLLSLTQKGTRSCGCLNDEVRIATAKGNKYALTDGLSRHPLYNTWATMIQRCYNPKSVKYYLYGERGIGVCKEWRHSFKTFLEEMGEKPEGTTLNRIDNDGNYCKNNCEWATFSDQNRNRRKYKRNKRRKDAEIQIDANSDN